MYTGRATILMNVTIEGAACGRAYGLIYLEQGTFALLKFAYYKARSWIANVLADYMYMVNNHDVRDPCMALYVVLLLARHNPHDAE